VKRSPVLVTDRDAVLLDEVLPRAEQLLARGVPVRQRGLEPDVVGLGHDLLALVVVVADRPRERALLLEHGVRQAELDAGDRGG
jgi:hypothetical protein